MSARELLVLDIDRTLLRSGEFSKIVAAALVHTAGLTTQQAETVVERALDSKGNLFDYLTWAKDEFDMTLPSAEDLAATILSTSEDLERRIIISGTREIVSAAQANDMPVLLMTAGSVYLQYIKVIVVQSLLAPHRLELNDYVITAPHQVKSTLLLDAFHDNSFDIQRLADKSLQSNVDAVRYTHTEHIVLVDDKPEYLVSDDPRLRGILASVDGGVADEKVGSVNLLDIAKIIN